MNFFHKYKIATRISLVIGIILLMMLVLAIIEVKGLNGIRNSLDEIVGKHYQRLQIAQEMRFLARHGAVVVRNVLLVSNEEERQKELARFEQGAKDYDELLRQLASQEQSDEEREIISAVIDGGEITFKIWRMITGPDSSNEYNQGMAILQAEVRNHQWGLLDNLDTLVQMEKRFAELSMQRALENYNRTKTVMFTINVLAFGAGLFFVAAITASIVGPLHEITRRVDRIAAGDLNTRIGLEQKDEVGQLARQIDRMVEKLQANEEELEEYKYNLEELIEWRTGEINDQRERFISLLIHDLKGPLVPIIGLSRLLLKKKNLPPEKLREYALAMHESSTDLAQTIEQTSKDLRSKRLSHTFDKKPFDFEDLLYSVANSAQPELEAQQIKLTINGMSPKDYGSTGDMLYAADIGKLRSMIENLIGNAGKYTETEIAIWLKDNGASIKLMVDDDGSGVAKEYRKKIFEEYSQAPGSREGTGIGLYSVKRIVDYYHGKVSASSSPLGGARFTVSLPLPQQPVPADEIVNPDISRAC